MHKRSSSSSSRPSIRYPGPLVKRHQGDARHVFAVRHMAGGWVVPSPRQGARSGECSNPVTSQSEMTRRRGDEATLP
eukprot:scaffold12296_cov27-Tisochrysis_lutea.AAC.3